MGIPPLGTGELTDLISIEDDMRACGSKGDTRHLPAVTFFLRQRRPRPRLPFSAAGTRLAADTVAAVRLSDGSVLRAGESDCPVRVVGHCQARQADRGGGGAAGKAHRAEAEVRHVVERQPGGCLQQARSARPWLAAESWASLSSSGLVIMDITPQRDTSRPLRQFAAARSPDAN